MAQERSANVRNGDKGTIVEEESVGDYSVMMDEDRSKEGLPWWLPVGSVMEKPKPE